MKSLKKSFIHFLISSFFVLVPGTASFAAPGPEVFPPLPFGQVPAEEVPSQNEENKDKHPPRPPRDPENIINYRGNRTYNENQPLKIIHTKCVCSEMNFVCLDIVFNQSINPRSVRHDTVLINNMPLPMGTRFAFSKKGDTIKISFPVNDNTYKLKVQGVCSFGGAVIDPVEILVEVER